MEKEIIARKSTDHDGMAQIDSVLSQVGESLRGGEWTATVKHTYSEKGNVLLKRVITIEHIQPKPAEPSP